MNTDFDNSLGFSPFAQLIDAKALSQAVAHSERLARLKSRVWRPLDKPLIPLATNADQARYDREVDGAKFRDLTAELVSAEAH